MEEQFRVIMDALAEIDREASEGRAALERRLEDATLELAEVRKYVATVVIELKSMKAQYQYAAHAGRAIHRLQELLRTKPAAAPLKLVKP